MTHHRPRYLRLVLRGGVVVAVVALLATAAVAATASHPTSYRTAVATRATVSEELHETGTVEPVAQATVAFPVSGTIATVAVKAGQSVATGQTLATLETSALEAALMSKQASLATAELTLHQALDGESTGTGNGRSGSNTANTGGSNAPAASSADTTATTAAASTTRGSGSDSGAGSTAAIASARQAVTRAQTQVNTALAAAEAAMDKASTACSTSTTSTTTTSTTASSTTAPTATTTAPPDSPSCATAQAAVMRALHTVANAEQALSQAESALGRLLTSATGSSTPSTTPATTPTTAAPSNAVTYTAKQLVAYETAVVAAAAEVTAAEQNLAQAKIVSPIAGTVAAVDLVSGQAVSAASSTANIVIVGDDGYEVTTTLSIAARAKVKVGDPATVIADGTGTELHGTVVAIGVATSSTTTYPVVIGFTNEPGAGAGLRNGASVALTIEVAQTTNALTVPTSAVQTVGTLHTVTVITNGKAKIVRVALSTVGAERTAITAGLKVGDIVALAEIGQAIPSSGSSTRTIGGDTTFGKGFDAGPRFSAGPGR